MPIERVRRPRNRDLRRGARVGVALVLVSSSAAAEEVVWARQAGLGGTYQGSSLDAGAVFTNPSGLGGVRGAALQGGFGAIVGFGRGASNTGDDRGTSVGFVPALALGLELADELHVGFGVRGGASSFVGYEFEGEGAPTFAEVGVTPFELAPAFSFTVPEDVLPGRLGIGVAYRVTAITASASSLADGTELGFAAHGFDGTGVRAGLGFSPVEFLRLGASVTNAVGVRFADGDAMVGGASEARIGTHSIPLTIGAGARADLDRFGLAFDYAFTDRRDARALVVDEEGSSALAQAGLVSLAGHGVRVGFEMRLPVDRAEVPLDVGYRLDLPEASASSSSAHAFVRHTASLGSGYRARDFSLHGALALSFDGGRADEGDCDLCNFSGGARGVALGLSIDGSFSLAR